MFVQGQRYRRRELHAQYGGQQQGGISTPANFPIIFIFTGESGQQHGYTDGWSDDGVFLYTGEGQVGDMTFVRGNAAVRDHNDNGKDLHIFEQADRGHVRYIGQMACTGWHRRIAPDTRGQPRQAIIFELVAVNEFADEVQGSVTAASQSGAGEDFDQLPLSKLRKMALLHDQALAVDRRA